MQIFSYLYFLRHSLYFLRHSLYENVTSWENVIIAFYRLEVLLSNILNILASQNASNCSRMHPQCPLSLHSKLSRLGIKLSSTIKLRFLTKENFSKCNNKMVSEYIHILKNMIHIIQNSYIYR